jgi:hypothetical protein
MDHQQVRSYIRGVLAHNPCKLLQSGYQMWLTVDQSSGPPTLKSYMWSALETSVLRFTSLYLGKDHPTDPSAEMHRIR